MTALQRISASIKRRRDSLFERQLSEQQEENDGPSILQEAKTFMAQAESSRALGNEELKTLRFLCDTLENSLNIWRGDQDQPQEDVEQENQGTIGKSGQEKAATPVGSAYTTWVAGTAQGQRHRKMMKLMVPSSMAMAPMRKESVISSGAVAVESMGTIHEEHEHGHGHGGGNSSIFGGYGTSTDGTSMERTVNLGQIQDALKLPNEPDLAGSAELIVYEEPEPIFVVILPHIALVLTVLAYLLLGSLFYLWIDPEIGAKSSARAFIWVFQLLATIGWGDSHASTSLSQAFTVLYVLAGIPMLFSAYANLGRLITEFCCRQGPALWRRLFKGADGKGQDVREEVPQQRLPLVIIANLLALHQCIGLLIYSVWLKDWPIISTIYFSITTMATSGFGDFHPDTDSWMETIVAVLYISVGIVLLSALFLTIALHYQAFHHIQLKEFIGRAYGQFLKWKEGGGEQKVGDVEKQATRK